MTISSSKPDALGELEQMVLLVVLRLDEEVYGVMVIQELEARTGRKHLAAFRLPDVGATGAQRLAPVAAGRSDAGTRRRAKRYYAVSATALALLRDSRRAYLNLWSGLEPRLDRR
jgi:hypothetical protein